ncbi:MAG TPA: hypothetical protein VMN36_10145 [Verrucomicrobiales bacterium]|nr:hypothetical protein [Verrucomicrobiales bacterium]
MTARRPRFPLAGITALAAGILPLHAQSEADLYARDVEFLLAELPKKAGRFFQTKGIDWKEVSAEFRSAVKEVKSDFHPKI